MRCNFTFIKTKPRYNITMKNNIRISRNKSMNYFSSLIYCINEANRLHLNNNITHNFNRVDGNNNKWFHHIVVEGVCGREFEVKFICDYGIPNGGEYIKILSWKENGETLDKFTGFRSFDNSLGTRFTLAYIDCSRNTPHKVYDFERNNTRETLTTEKVFGVDDMGIGEDVYMPVRLSNRVRGEYTITLPSGTVIRVREEDIKDTCIRVIKRKPVKNH